MHSVGNSSMLGKGKKGSGVPSDVGNGGGGKRGEKRDLDWKKLAQREKKMTKGVEETLRGTALTRKGGKDRFALITRQT